MFPLDWQLTVDRPNSNSSMFLHQRLRSADLTSQGHPDGTVPASWFPQGLTITAIRVVSFERLGPLERVVEPVKR